MRSSVDRWQSGSLGVLFVGIAALNTACSSASGPPASESSAAGEEIPAGQLEDSHSSTWEKVEIVDDHHVRLYYTISPWLPCERRAVTVAETESDVTFTLYIGQIAHSDQICGASEPRSRDMSGHSESILAVTQNPIGDRRIVNGHDGKTISHDKIIDRNYTPEDAIDDLS